MLHNDITNDVRILTTGFSESSIKTDDGEEMLPSGYYMEIEVDGEQFVIPVDQTTYQTIHNAINSIADMSPEVEVDEAV